MSMFNKAVVGVDYSPAEESLLSCLPDLHRWGIKTVVLVHVKRLGYVQGGFSNEEAYIAWLEGLAAPLKQAGLEVETSVTTSGIPAEALLSIARAEGADMVVVGSRSQNLILDLFLGSVAKDIIRKTDIPVLIEWLAPAKDGEADTCAAVCRKALDHILLATDISEQSRRAETAAVALAAKAGQIDILTVLPQQDGDGDRDRDAAERRHQELVGQISAAGGSASSRIESGEASEVVERVGQEGYSLIIVGKHGRNWVAEKIIGSTAAKLCETARRPVLLVPLEKK